MELFIVRHGKTYWNAEGKLQGRTNIDLNEEGREAAIAFGNKLEEQNLSFDLFYSSPLIRAYETACLIRGRKNIPILRDDRLLELSFGVQEGCIHALWEESHHFFHQPELYRTPKDGETLSHLCDRAREFIQSEIEPQYGEKKRIMIVAHGALNKALMCYLEGNDLPHFWGERLQNNCEATIFTFDGQTWKR